MRDNKGFTIIELLSSIVLISIISIVLIEVIVSLRDMYVSSGMKTELLNKQGILSNKINDALITNQVDSITSCGEDCIKFTYLDSTFEILQIDKPNNMISFGNYKTNLVNNSTFGNIEIQKLVSVFTHPYKNDSILNIKIPIYTSLFKDSNYGLNIVFQYNSSDTFVDL